ncbi:MAG TPA: hypothetical protein VJQ82_01335 [Terriglobales bacterium]|nr:hypothetical protein [Terriglobales bacterium]
MAASLAYPKSPVLDAGQRGLDAAQLVATLTVLLKQGLPGNRGDRLVAAIPGIVIQRASLIA